MILKKIAPTAIIEEGAKIADNVEIGHFCVIGADVEIGEGTKVHNHVTLAGKTTIGKNNTIFPGAVLGTQPQDLKYAGEQTELIIGDGNLIREFAMFNPGTAGDLGKTIIGNHNLFMAYTHIAHDCVIGDRCILANGATLGGHIHVAISSILEDSPPCTNSSTSEITPWLPEPPRSPKTFPLFVWLREIEPSSVVSIAIA